MERDAVLNVRLPADMKEALRVAAEDDHGRSMSGMVTRIVGEWLTATGYLRKKRGRKES
jgi:hypothetical protein